MRWLWIILVLWLVVLAVLFFWVFPANARQSGATGAIVLRNGTIDVGTVDAGDGAAATTRAANKNIMQMRRANTCSTQTDGVWGEKCLDDNGIEWVCNAAGGCNAANWQAMQPSDADLTALAALSTTGVVARTGTGTMATRTLQEGNDIDITNGDGVSGDPTIAFDPTETATTTWGAGSAFTWTFDASSGTDTTLDFGDGIVQFGGKATLMHDGGTFSSASAAAQPIALQITPTTLTLAGTNPGFFGIASTGTVIWEDNQFVADTAAFFQDATLHTNPTTEARTWRALQDFDSRPTFQCDTAAGCGNPSYTGFASHPSVTTINSGTMTGGSATGMSSTVFVGTGVTLQTRTGVSIADVSGSGTTTTQIGLSIANLSAAGTNWSIQSGVANSYFAGNIMLQGTGTPSDAINFSGEANEVIKMIDEATSTDPGRSVTLQAGGSGSGSNLSGGTLILASGNGRGGNALGNGGSIIELQAVDSNQGTGSTQRTPVARWRLRDGHVITIGTAPTPSGTNCGTIAGTDVAGTLTPSGGATTSCTITFAKAFTTNAPVCSAVNGTASARNPTVISTSTTALTLTIAANASDKVFYQCVGWE